MKALLLALAFVAQAAYAGPPIIWFGDKAKIIASGGLVDSSGAAIGATDLTAITTNVVPSGSRNIGTSAAPWNTVRSSQVFTPIYNIQSNATTEKSAIRGDGGTTPSGTSVQSYWTTSVGGEGIGIFPNTDGGANASQAGSLYLQGANKSAGTGNGGDVVLWSGTSAGGTRGKIKLQEGTHGTANHTLMSSDTGGSVNWKNVYRQEYAALEVLCNTGNCTIARQGPTSNWLSNVASGSPNTLTITNGIFSVAPYCVISGATATVNLFCAIWSTTTTSVTYYCVDAAGTQQPTAKMYIYCSGAW